MLQPFMANFVDNPIVVQFVHRWLAWVVAAGAIVLAVQAWSRKAYLSAIAVIATVVAQILLGIATLVSGVELWIAVAHQGMAALVIAALVAAAHRLGWRRASA